MVFVVENFFVTKCEHELKRLVDHSMLPRLNAPDRDLLHIASAGVLNSEAVSTSNLFQVPTGGSKNQYQFIWK